MDTLSGQPRPLCLRGLTPQPQALSVRYAQVPDASRASDPLSRAEGRRRVHRALTVVPDLRARAMQTRLRVACAKLLAEPETQEMRALAAFSDAAWADTPVDPGDQRASSKPGLGG